MAGNRKSKKKQINRAFYIGRFQPFHLGHLKVISEIAREVDELVIGIGSAQMSHTPENPFNAGERIMMISRSLEDPGLVLTTSYQSTTSTATPSGSSHVGVDDPAVFPGIFQQSAGIQTFLLRPDTRSSTPPMYNRTAFSGTEIRRECWPDEDWQQLVPPAVVKVVEEVNGVERLKQVSMKGDIESVIES